MTGFFRLLPDGFHIIAEPLKNNTTDGSDSILIHVTLLCVTFLSAIPVLTTDGL